MTRRSFARHTLVLVAIALAFAAMPQFAQAQRTAIAIHGGAGVIDRATMTSELEAQYREALSAAVLAGHRVLERGGSSLDAVESTLVVLEDHPLFNAGKGAVFTHKGVNELDAAIMDGRTLGAGSIAAVTRVKNPITLARRVMERSKHVMLVGAGAEEFAREQGITLVPTSYFYTERRWKQLQRELAKEKAAQDSLRKIKAGGATGFIGGDGEGKYGTVGCVALDRNGNLAAGTSTGGTTNKRYGRVGDSPIIGSGTYADNRTCAVSATGTGEFFIRSVAAHSVASLVERGVSVQAAADTVITNRVGRIGGDGGLIAMDRRGAIAMAFNTPGMYRAWIDEQGRPVVWIWRDR